MSSSSSTTNRWLRAGEWHRVGHGLTVQFYATDRDVEKLLREALSRDYRPYTLVGFDRIRQGPRSYEWRPFECSPTDFVGCRRGPDEQRTKWFIRSHALTPRLPESDVSDEREWSLNGLIDLQHGGRLREKYTESSIGMAHRVRNDVTGEELRNREYESIYTALRAALKVKARHAVIRSFPDGTRLLDKTLALMTDDARELARSQSVFDVEPAD